jgi:hypothetical protein
MRRHREAFDDDWCGAVLSSPPPLARATRTNGADATPRRAE